MSRATFHLCLAILVVTLADQASKWSAELQGRVTLNKGISFGLFSLLPHSALVILLIAMLLFVWYMYRFAWQRQPIASGLFFGGGISNLVDRLLLNGVRDWVPVPFLNLQNNLADYAIALGLAWLLFFGLRKSYNQSVAVDDNSQPTK